jgi:hypothetical protein
MTTEWTRVLADLKTELPPLFGDLVTTLGEDIGKDLEKYAIAIANDLTATVARLALADDEVVQKNLQHLKAQLMMLAVAEHVHVSAVTIAKMNEVLTITMRIVLGALRIATTVA